jgi:hypothetical protein
MGVRCIGGHLYEKNDVLGTIASRKRKDVYADIMNQLFDKGRLES